MRRIISVLLAALLVFLVMASAAGALAASAATRKVKIKAMDSETGNAVCSVKVKIYQVTNPAKGTTKYLMTVRTDSKGIRTVDLEPGTYRIVAVAGAADVLDSFIPGRTTRFYFLEKTKQITVEEGKDKTVTLKLARDPHAVCVPSCP